MNVSVVIPAYNEEEYIGRCLKSLKEQTVAPYEIIVVDNNCTDSTAEVARQYGVTVLREKEQGMIPARNAGYTAAKGDLIARTDSDAVLPPDWIAKIQKVWSEGHPAALSGPITYYDLPMHSPGYSKLFFHFFKSVCGYYPVLGPNCILEKSMWNTIQDKVCSRDKDVHEDLDLAIHIAQQNGQIVYDPSLLVKVSGRRIVNRPESFFLEYAVRFLKTVHKHR